MNILKTSSEELTVKQIYQLTKTPEIQKMSTAEGSRIEVLAWAIYTDRDSKGEEQTIVSLLTPDGESFATNSPTFLRDFSDLVDMFTDAGEKVKAIKVIGGDTKSGRHFITCAYAD